MDNVLVTGGAGYVGSHICKALSQEGLNPIVIDDLSRGNRSLIKYGEFFEGSIADSKFVSRVYERTGFESVIHCAAFAYVGESTANPRMYYENNVINSIKLLGSLVDFNIKNIIFSSSCATYGISNNRRITTKDDQKPINPYGETKLIFEKVLRDYSSIYRYNYGILRYFNVAGCDPESEIGELHEPETHIIPLLIKAALDDDYWFTINGDDYPTPDGTCIRDYIHVSDLARAHVLALLSLLTRNEPLIYNIGNGQGFSILEIVSVVEKVTKRKVKVKAGRRRPGDPPILIACTDEVKDGLAWTPKFSDLETIVTTATAWYKKNEVFRSDPDI